MVNYVLNFTPKDKISALCPFDSLNIIKMQTLAFLLKGVNSIIETLRHELKFLISAREAAILQQKLKAIMSYDSHGKDGTYVVESLYFDDFYSTFLKEKLDGAEKNPKFRIRAYNKDLTLLKLERKQKKGDIVSKKSMNLSCEDYIGFMKDSMSYASEFPELHSALLKPKVIVSYERTAFIYEPGNVRITFDRHLKTSINAKPDLFKPACSKKVYEDDRVIYEVKYTGFLPLHLRGLLNEARNKQSLSKYTLCRLSSLV